VAARPASQRLPITDGRAARSHRTRISIIDAAIRLLEAGDLRPTTERIAAAAGVSTRSIFLHFADVDSLFTATVDRFAERLFSSLKPVELRAPLAQRVSDFARQRARLCEAMAPAARAAALHEPFSDGVHQRLRQLRRRLREEIERTFLPELERASFEERRELLEALTATATFAHWDSLRRYQGLSRARAEKVLERSVAALLASLGR